MEITLYRYTLERANWSSESVNESFIETLVEKLKDEPFQGDDLERQYGFVHCGYINEIIYGLFIQKFPTVSTDYDAETKKENKQNLVDSGAYLFILRPKEYEIYFQSKRSSNLPEKEEITRRLNTMLRLALSKTQYIFSKMTETEDIVERNHIVNIFYTEAETVLEMEFSDFDPSLVAEEKAKRNGQRQKYFNPIEDYQEAMEEASIRIGTNASKATIKSKKDGNLQKDPITRAMLESSKRPTKIVYTKENKEITDSAVTKKKEVISIEGTEFNLEDKEQALNIITKLFSKGEARPIKGLKEKDSNQINIFDNE